MTFVKHQTINNEFQSDLTKLLLSAVSLKNSSKLITDDITNTASQLKKHLQQAIDKFFAVINAVDGIVCIKDDVGKWKTLNTFGQTFYNLSQDDYVGKTTEEISNNFPEISESLLNCIGLDAAWNTGNKPIKSIQQCTINSTEYFFNISKTPIFTRDNKFKELIIIGKDITFQTIETRKNQACLIALNSASEAIVLLDKHKTVIFFNVAFANRFPDVKNQMSITEIYQSTDSQHEIAKWNKVLNCCDIWCQPLTYLFENKSIACEEKIIPIMNGDTKPIHYICLLRYDE